MIRAVLDTNMLVSALISSTGNEALILLAVRQGLVKPLFSAEILQEYAEVLARPKFAFSQDEIEALIAMLRSQGEEVQDPAPLTSGLPDPGDDKFLACARAAGADFIVTGNKRHFPPRACGAIRVANAAELLDRYNPRNLKNELPFKFHIYPTMSEALNIVALAFTKDVSRLSCCAE